MNSLRLAMIVIVSAMLLGCQASGDLVQRDPTAATSTQDVIDAWNLHCAEYNFYSIPIPDATLMGHAYRGTNFEIDSLMFMIAIQSEVICTSRLDPELDDTLSEVINDPVWYE